MTAAPIDLHWVQQAGSRPASLLRPSTVVEAAQAMAADPRLRPVAGGTDLLLELARDRVGDEVPLIDMTGIAGFRDLRFGDTGATLGAGVTHADVLASAEARTQLLPLAQACLEIGSPQLRNRATLVGNLVTASPANDTISALLALDASVTAVRHADGALTQREINLEDFYAGFRATTLQPGELITAITVAPAANTRRGIWVKAGLRKAQAISVVHAGLVLEFDADEIITSARIAIGSVGPTVALSQPASEALVGSRLEAAVIDAAARAAVASVAPIDDGRATADYRNESVAIVVSRALTALSRQEEAKYWPERVPLLRTSTASPTAAEQAAAVHQPIETGGDVTVSVNGTALTAPSTGAGTLLDWLRDVAGTGTKEGCAEGECGACTVQMDGAAVMSCLVPAAQADGADVTTIEGLGSADQPTRMQQAFVDKFAVQCGYCIPGFVVAAQTLADEFGSVPTRDEIELALSGNLCRCTGYYNIIDAVTTAISGAFGAQAQS